MKQKWSGPVVHTLCVWPTVRFWPTYTHPALDLVEEREKALDLEIAKG